MDGPLSQKKNWSSIRYEFRIRKDTTFLFCRIRISACWRIFLSAMFPQYLLWLIWPFWKLILSAFLAFFKTILTLLKLPLCWYFFLSIMFWLNLKYSWLILLCCLLCSISPGFCPKNGLLLNLPPSLLIFYCKDISSWIEMVLKKIVCFELRDEKRLRGWVKKK